MYESKQEQLKVLMNQEERSRVVIFLDIDGVLQPPMNQARFKHDLEVLRRTIAEDFSDGSYFDLDEYDLGAIYYDWDKEAVELLRNLCQDFGAEIVVISDWRRSKSVDQLKAYFRIHHLDQYVTDKTDEGGTAPYYRAGEVKAYLDLHPSIERFVIIDDGYRESYAILFPKQLVQTRSRIEAADEMCARQILSSFKNGGNDRGAR